MGFRTAAVFVERVGVEELLERMPDGFSFERTGERVGFDVASSRRLEPALAVGRVRAWTALWDATGRFVLKDRVVAELSRGTRALAIALGGGGSFGFALYQDQKCVRRLLYSAAQSSESIGAPLAVEKSHRTPAVDEALVWLILKHVTKLEAASLAKSDFERVRVSG